MRGLIRPVTFALALLVALAAAWVFAPRPDRFRTFDPRAVGHAEMQMWRAYYERTPLQLSTGLVLNASWDFGFSPYDSARLGYQAGMAARTFQRSHSRAEAEAALPALQHYYEILRLATHGSFDPAHAAALELEWWQLRREYAYPEEYAPAVGAAAAYLYGVNPAAVHDYAALRADAMHLRDSHSRDMTDAEWTQIEALLVRAYTSLRDNVRPQPPSRASAAL